MNQLHFILLILYEQYKISALSSGNVGKYEVLLAKQFYRKKTCYKKLLQSKDLNICH